MDPRGQWWLVYNSWEALPPTPRISVSPAQGFLWASEERAGSWSNRAAEEVRGEIGGGARGSSASLDTQPLSPLVPFPWAPGRAAFCFPQIYSPYWAHLIPSETHPPHCEDSSVISFQSWVVFEPDYGGIWRWPLAYSHHCLPWSLPSPS